MKSLAQKSLVVLSAVMLSSCAGGPSAQTGTVAGAVVGGVAGNAIGRNNGNAALGTVAGAVAGGAVGNAIGDSYDRDRHYRSRYY